MLSCYYFSYSTIQQLFCQKIHHRLGSKMNANKLLGSIDHKNEMKSERIALEIIHVLSCMRRMQIIF